MSYKALDFGGLYTLADCFTYAETGLDRIGFDVSSEKISARVFGKGNCLPDPGIIQF